MFISKIPRIQLELSAMRLIVIVAAYILVVNNYSLWHELYQVGQTPFYRAQLIFSVAGFLFAIYVLLLSLFSFRGALKIVTILFVVLSSIVAFFADHYGVIVDRGMVANILQTDFHEASELISVRFFLSLTIFGLLPACLISRVQIRYRTFGKEFISRALVLVVCVIGAVGFAASNYKSIAMAAREHKQVRMFINPVFPIYSTVSYIYRANASSRKRLPIAQDAIRSLATTTMHKPRLLVVVVGETARADHFSLNGYGRETTPELRQRQVFNFREATSCATATAYSVPCMFSHLSRADFSLEKAKGYENVLDVLQNVGVDVHWWDNDGGCKGVCNRVINERLDGARIQEWCVDGGCYDEILLSGLVSSLKRVDADAVIVLHQMGSHGPAYSKRSPKSYKAFLPECTRDDVERCTQEEIVNAYDNSIYYTDHFLAALIDELKGVDHRFDVAMMYASDHGESLGEDGLYLHGLPYFMAPRSQTHVPFVLWMSNGAMSDMGVNESCMRQRADQPASHDVWFHTLLGWFDVQTNWYDSDLDVLATCREGSGSKKVLQAHVGAKASS